MPSLGFVPGLGLIPSPGMAGPWAAELPPAPILEEDAAATQGWYLRADASLAGLSVSSRLQPAAFRIGSDAFAIT